MAIAGASAITMQAWFYSETANSVILEVLRTPTSGTVASGTFATAGWHSLPLPAITQSELDNLVLRFRTTTGHSHIVQASFVKVSYTPSPAKVYWGADMDGEVANLERDSLGNPLPVRLDAPWTQETWDLFEQHAGKPVSIVHFGQPAPWNQSFAASPLELTSARGAIPMISMGSIGATLSELEEGGVKESALAKWAQEVAKYQKPFFLRWDWEMNLPSSTSLLWVNEAHSNPAAFVRAWRNFHRIAEREGASNITWVWCPNVSFLGSTSLKSLYPGNSYVDWTCMDGYNFGTMPGGSGWKSFSNVFSSTYAELTSSDFDGRAKPIMVGETASTEQGGSKPDWIAQALGTSMPDSFPKIKALVWFNWNITENGFEHDWPIESPVTTPSGPSPSAAAFANAISSPYYAGNTFGSLAPLTRIQPLP
ncbi:MAG TPA: glycosyl hydrolase [Solirubrobacterales bacterium]|nr:glycosyl hydrolase [Solirubrobacterales bacterium]